MCGRHRAEESEKMGLTVEKFKAVASMAASRAFYVGGKYQEAFVPSARHVQSQDGANSSPSSAWRMRTQTMRTEAMRTQTARAIRW